ncbi:MAG: hypothetical protein QQM50_01995 [Dehalococcoides mccartyi]|uniref:hypothetical protein n=1 Tax=Dehalococcoides TaxID=61434 RepID=UPI002737E2B8|nr:hypothetical protein [Dehalococcoides mccartyi]MDP4279308.1 hypothetical protein [Dehalococcoides mccartyi]
MTRKELQGSKGDLNLRAETGQRAVEVLKAKAKLSKQLIACYQSLANYTRRRKKTAGWGRARRRPLYLIYYPQLHADEITKKP